MARRLIICTDGTWNQAEEKTASGETSPTNVLRIARAVSPVAGDGVSQLVYYHKGLGTGGAVDKFLGGVMGIGMSRIIENCYRFLANNYQDGDEIYLFGFSRGAYTARSLGGLINLAGLLRKQDLEHFSKVHHFYRQTKAKRAASPDREFIFDLFKDSRRPVIHFIGVWDTVGALGVPVPLLGKISRLWIGFHDTRLRNVKYAYHALAADERRGPFAPNLWTRKPGADDSSLCEMKQTWFPGAHSDVGGGYADHTLAEITYVWMAQKAARCGLELTGMGDKPDYTGLLHDSYFFFYRLAGLAPWKGLREYRRPVGQLHRDIKGEKKGQFEIMHQSLVDRFFHDEDEDGALQVTRTFNPDYVQIGVEELPVENWAGETEISLDRCDETLTPADN